MNTFFWLSNQFPQHRVCLRKRDQPFSLMNTRNLLALLLVLAGSCQKNEAPSIDQLSVLTTLQSEHGLTYEQSSNKWHQLREQNGNSYVYQTTFASWTGSGNTTELKIENGVVTSRIYEEFTTLGDGSKKVLDFYREDSGTLGTHAKGAALLTIDGLYETCAKDYLVADEQNNTIYFETAPDGLLTLCGFVPKECVDDCYTGVRIHAFEWVNKK
jgi:hypothetical protein